MIIINEGILIGRKLRPLSNAQPIPEEFLDDLDLLYYPKDNSEPLEVEELKFNGNQVKIVASTPKYGGINKSYPLSSFGRDFEIKIEDIYGSNTESSVLDFLKKHNWKVV